MKTLLLALCLLFCVGCSRHKLYVIGADEEQFSHIKDNLRHSGIKVIKQNHLSSDFERLTLVSAIAFPIETVEAALDQFVHTTLAQGKNHFYTNSAGLYFPSYQPKLVDIYSNSCNNLSVTLTTFQDDFYQLTIEKFIESNQGYEYITIGEYHGMYSFNDKTMNGFNKEKLLFSADEYYEQAVHADALNITAIGIKDFPEKCAIYKRNNHR